PHDPLIGRTVAQYDIVDKIGGGGMGVVYRARDSKLGRTVALKFLPPQWSHDEGAKQRFLREAQAASATNHRNICIIHDIEQTEDGQLFIVMAYYEGQTLKQKLEAGALPVADAVEIAAEVAEGLAKAHAQGIVHRDIKPGNLIVTEDGVKILDFGLAKFADALQLTQPGSTLGTVGYMAPEQARGAGQRPSTKLWPRLGIACAVLAIAATATNLWLARTMARTSIAVDPVANHTGEPELDGYRLALTRSLVAELADSPNLRVAAYS